MQAKREYSPPVSGSCFSIDKVSSIPKKIYWIEKFDGSFRPLPASSNKPAKISSILGDPPPLEPARFPAKTNS